MARMTASAPTVQMDRTTAGQPTHGAQGRTEAARGRGQDRRHRWTGAAPNGNRGPRAGAALWPGRLPRSRQGLPVAAMAMAPVALLLTPGPSLGSTHGGCMPWTLPRARAKANPPDNSGGLWLFGCMIRRGLRVIQCS